jgi:propanol-preferring alcohol dehydrogenase
MVWPGPRQALVREERPVPAVGPGQVRVRVEACGVCRTDLHVVDGELPHPKVPLVLGHEIVGRVDEKGEGVDPSFEVGTRVAIPWLGWTCGQCRYCREGRENLCPQARFTGYTLDGGYADFAVADARYTFPVPPELGDSVHVAPLVCAGLIGFRALRLAGQGQRVGLYGFGAAAHILAQVLRHQGREVYAFTRPGDEEGQAFARELGAVWAGGSDTVPPVPLDAALLFAPAGELVPRALEAVVPGGTVVAAGIHMSHVPSFPYRLLWEERQVRSVANLTREDARAFFAIAPQVGVRTHVQVYPLEEAPKALEDLRAGRVRGAAVLAVSAAS